MVGFAFAQWNSLMFLHPSFSFLGLAQNRAEHFFSLGRYCGLFRDGTFLAGIHDFVYFNHIPLNTFYFGAGLPLFIVLYLLTALFYVSWKTFLLKTVSALLAYNSFWIVLLGSLKITVFTPWKFVFIKATPTIIVLFIIEWISRIWRGLSVSHVTDSKLFRLIFFPYKHYNNYSSYSVFSLILRRIRNFVLFQVYFIFFNPFYFLVHVILAYSYWAKIMLIGISSWWFGQITVLFSAVYTSITVNPVYLLFSSLYSIFLTPLYLWTLISWASFTFFSTLQYMANTVLVYATHSITIVDRFVFLGFDNRSRPIIAYEAFFVAVEGSMFSWAFTDNFLEKFDYSKLLFLFKNLNSLNAFSLQYIMTIDFIIFLLFSLSAYYTLTSPTFRKKVFFFFSFIVISTMWGFYASFDGFILFFLSTELLIIVLLLMLSMTGKYNSLSTRTKLISFNVYSISCLVVYWLSAKYFGFHSVYRVPNWYAGYKDIITGDLFAIFYFFFVRHQFTVIATTLILSLFTIFFILVYSHFRHLQQRSDSRDQGLIILRKQNLFHQFRLHPSVKAIRYKFISKLNKYTKSKNPKRVDLDAMTREKLVYSKCVSEEFLKDKRLKKRI